MKKTAKPKAVYSWRNGSPYPKKKAAAAAREIEQLKKSQRSTHISAEQLVAFAEHTRGTLYELIGDWDDAVAGPKWRLERARGILRSIEIHYEGSDKAPVRCFYHIEPAESDDSIYIPTIEILGDSDRRARLLRRALDEAESWRRRYVELKELADVFDAIDRTRKRKHRQQGSDPGLRPPA